MGKKTEHIDWFLFLPIVALMLFSIAFVYSASAFYAEHRQLTKEFFFREHAIRILLGLAIIILVSKFDYHKWEKFAKAGIIVSIILLIMVLVSGITSKGASRWIDFGFISFQPSEFAKLSLVLYLAAYLTKNQEIIKDFQAGLLPPLLWIGFICFLIALQPNFSTTVVIFLIAIIILFLGNANFKHLFLTSLIGLGLSGIYALFVSKYPAERIQTFLGNMQNSSETSMSHQVEQALIALGTGGIFGLGPGHSKQNLLFLPESFGDFIYSIIGEEYGFIGASLIIIVFIIICWRGLKISKHAPDDFGFYLSTGITISFALYAFVNAGVNTGLLPPTGLPMPFVSYGGTAVLFYSTAAGILLNISSQAGIYPKKPTK
jgi:cell division protein FtsW